MKTKEDSGCISIILDFFNLSPKPEKSGIDFSAFSQRQSILTKNEQEFFTAITQILENRYLVFAKVRLADIFIIKAGENYKSNLNRINSRHVDFLLCKPDTLQMVCGIEIDDSSHRKSNRKTRDEFVDQLFQSAGLPLCRIPAKMKYNPEYIRPYIFQETPHQKTSEN